MIGYLVLDIVIIVALFLLFLLLFPMQFLQMTNRTKFVSDVDHAGHGSSSMPPPAPQRDLLIESIVELQITKIAKLESRIKNLEERMTRARNILTKDNPTPNCNWGMLDVTSEWEANHNEWKGDHEYSDVDSKFQGFH